jgi:hypothetical protein
MVPGTIQEEGEVVRDMKDMRENKGAPSILHG